MVLTDSWDDFCTTDMALEQDAFGSTIFDVQDQRHTLATALMAAGAHTTVDITRTSQLHAFLECLSLVSGNSESYPLLCYHVGLVPV